jgi:hypothetical protein
LVAEPPWRPPFCWGSVFIGAHDGKHARRLFGVVGVVGARREVWRVVIELEEVAFSLKVDRAEVVLAVRSLSFAKLLWD